MIGRNTLRRLQQMIGGTPAGDVAVTAAAAPVGPAQHPKLAANMEILGNGYGQSQSFATHRPVDANGHASPWFTYPALEYLKRFDCRNWRIFEYGAGQSTIYWSDRGASVTTVEHNEQWFRDTVQRKLPNARIFHRTDARSYADVIHQSNGPFDVIVIDGVWREVCAETCIDWLASTGFIILDNSDWYHEAAAKLRAKGFLEVSFSGFGPVNDYTWTTSLFFRTPLMLGREMTAPDPIGGLRLKPGDIDGYW